MDPTLERDLRQECESPVPGSGEGDDARDAWEREREGLLDLLTRQQRSAQAGMVTAGLAHDVANYVQLISGVSFLALERKDPEDWRLALESVQDHCRQLSDLTRAFLGLLRRREPVGGTTFRLSSVLEETRKLVQTHARQERVDLVFLLREDGVAEGEGRLLVQAVLNLVTNAVHACKTRSGRVEVEVRTTVEGMGRIRVTDNGGGIPECVRHHLFRPGAAGAGREDGHGLGLFVVRQAVRSLGGRISVETSESGTIFTLDIPLAPSAPDDSHLPRDT